MDPIGQALLLFRAGRHSEESKASARRFALFWHNGNGDAQTADYRNADMAVSSRRQARSFPGRPNRSQSG